MNLFLKNKAFTMAEMLVSLTIIGIIAALTMPSVKMNTEKRANAELLKKAVAKLDSVTEMTQVESKFQPLKCFYDNGTVNNEQCEDFYDYITANLKTIKNCDTNALSEGCAPTYQQGADDIWQEKNKQRDDQSEEDYQAEKDNATLGCEEFRLEQLNTKTAFITSDGMIFYPYKKKFDDSPIFLVDVNGKRGPNKFGYDLFTLQLKGSLTQTPTWGESSCEYVSSGGHTVKDILTGNY